MNYRIDISSTLEPYPYIIELRASSKKLAKQQATYLFLRKYPTQTITKITILQQGKHIMEMNSAVAGFLVGIFVAITLTLMPISDASLYQSAIKECQRQLPRDQRCKVVGVIDESNLLK